MVRRRRPARPRLFVARERVGPATHGPKQIAEALAHDEDVALAVPALGERRERALVVSNRVVVRVDPARPVPRGRQVARPAGAVGAQAEVVAERLEVLQALRGAAAGALEACAGASVQLDAPTHEEVLIEHLLDERVLEPVPQARRVTSDFSEQPSVHQPVEARLDTKRISRHRAEQRFVEDRPEHGRLLDEAPLVGRQAIESREKERLERDRYLDRRTVRPARPPVPVPREHTVGDEAAHDFLHVERVASHARHDPRAEPRRDHARRDAEEAGEERLRLGVGERRQADDRVRGAAWRERPVTRLGPQRRQEHEGPIVEPIHDLAQQLHRGRVRPLEILDHEYERDLRQAPLEYGPGGENDLSVELLGLDFGHALARLEAEHVADERRHTFRLSLTGSERLQPLDELPPRDLERVRGRDPVGVTQEGREHAVGLLAERGAGGVADLHAGETSVRFEAPEEFGEEPRLARAGLADEAHDLGPPACHPLERREQLAHLVVPADQRRHEPERVQTA